MTNFKNYKEKFKLSENSSFVCKSASLIYGGILIISLLFKLICHISLQLPDEGAIIKVLDAVATLFFVVLFSAFWTACFSGILPVIVAGCILSVATYNAFKEKNIFAVINPWILGTCAITVIAGFVAVDVVSACF